MRKVIALLCTVLLLTVVLTGCFGRGNVSDDSNGKITEDTSRTEVTKPTTAPTDATTATTTHRETEPTTTPSTTAGTTATENTTANSTTHSSSDTTDNENNSSPADGGRARRSGLMGGNGRF